MSDTRLRTFEEWWGNGRGFATSRLDETDMAAAYAAGQYAAPDLLDALESAMRIKELWCAEEKPLPEHAAEAWILVVMLEKFEAAIAKATGGPA